MTRIEHTHRELDLISASELLFLLKALLILLNIDWYMDIGIRIILQKVLFIC